MASNELAAILARRRTKDGTGNAAAVATEPNAASSTPSAAAVDTGATGGAASPAPRLSIAERIAKMQQQSAAAGPAPVPIPIATSHRQWQPSSVATTSASEAAESDPPSTSSGAEPTAETADSGTRRLSDRIQQLQGNLGVNPFRPGGPPGGFRKPGSGGGSSIMTTGDQYAHTHGMGIAMPGMGAAIPMPGLAKAGTRIPGMASSADSPAESDESSATASLEASHATMSRATGPKRRGPTTRPPPGAFRLPGAGPVAESTASEPTPTPEPVSVESPSTPSATLFPALTPVAPESETATSLFGGSVSNSPAPTSVPTFTSTPAYETMPPKPSPSSSSLFEGDSADSVSIGGLSIASETAKPIPSVAPTSKPEPTSLFGGGPVQWTNAPDAASSTTTAPPPAPVPTPATIAPPSRAASSTLFSAAANDDHSSESDWSDDEGSKPTSQPTLFGAPVPRPSMAAPSASSPMVSTPSPAPVSYSGSSSSLFGDAPAAVAAPTPAPTSQRPSSAGSLFGPASAGLSSSSTSGPTPIARPPQQYTSLFGGPDDDDSDESDDEGGLFGTGLPSSR